MQEGRRILRTFLALELPEEFRDEITEKIGELAELFPKGVKWVIRSHLHITMQFIGDTDISQISLLREKFGSMLRDLPAFRISRPEIEIIPFKNPRLIWIKCDFDNRALPDTVHRIRVFLKKMGFQIDKKPFRLHITLGRVKNSIIGNNLVNVNLPILKDREWTISKATFYESRLHTDGPEYIKIATFNLQEEE